MEKTLRRKGVVSKIDVEIGLSFINRDGFDSEPTSAILGYSEDARDLLSSRNDSASNILFQSGKSNEESSEKISLKKELERYSQLIRRDNET